MLYKFPLIFCLLTSQAFGQAVDDTVAQNPRNKEFALKVNYLSPFYGAVCIHSEIPTLNMNAVNVFVFAGFRNFEGNGVEGYGIGAEYKFYHKGAPLSGGNYISPFVRYRDIKLWGDYKETVNGVVTFEGHKAIPVQAIGGGIVFGKQWLLGNRILIDLFGGPDINYILNSDPDRDDVGLEALKILTSLIGIRFGTTFGFKFN